MDEDRFGFAVLGGCAASQKGLPLSRLYHRILAARWKAEYGIRMNVILDRYDQTLDYAARVERCLARCVPQAVLVHVRPSPFLVRCKPFIRYADRSGGIRWVLHPRLLPWGRRAWNPDWDGTHVIGTPAASMEAAETSLRETYPPYRHSLLRSLHVSLGAMTGLAAWAIRAEILAVGRAAAICAAAGIPLFILGPTPFPRSPMGNRLCQALAAGLRREQDVAGYGFIEPIGNKDADARGFLMPDGWHLNAAGHAEIAEAIFRGLERAEDRLRGTGKSIAAGRGNTPATQAA